MRPTHPGYARLRGTVTALAAMGALAAFGGACTSAASPAAEAPVTTEAPTAAPSGEGSGGGAPESGTVILTVRRGDAVLATWTLERLQAELPAAEVVADGDRQRGPLLLAVLEASGAGDWSRLEAGGMSQGRAFEVALEVARAEVDEGWILDISNRGTLKLAADGLPRQRWVRDVTEIVVE